MGVKEIELQNRLCFNGKWWNEEFSLVSEEEMGQESFLEQENQGKGESRYSEGTVTTFSYRRAGEVE